MALPHDSGSGGGGRRSCRMASGSATRTRLRMKACVSLLYWVMMQVRALRCMLLPAPLRLPSPRARLLLPLKGCVGRRGCHGGQWQMPQTAATATGAGTGAAEHNMGEGPPSMSVGAAFLFTVADGVPIAANKDKAHLTGAAGQHPCLRQLSARQSVLCC